MTVVTRPLKRSYIASRSKLMLKSRATWSESPQRENYGHELRGRENCAQALSKQFSLARQLSLDQLRVQLYVEQHKPPAWAIVCD
jgi:hypothetical protein